MKCWNEKCEFYGTGSCAIGLPQDKRLCHKELPEGANIEIILLGCGSNDVIAKAVLDRTFEVKGNALIMVNGGLYSTDNITPVEQIDENNFKVYCYIQDAYKVDKNVMSPSITES